MSVLNYLQTLASSTVLGIPEKESIKTSITTLQNRLEYYLGNEISEHFLFGSYTRETILPRHFDDESDIDYMVVFNDNKLKPQTYLNKLKEFVSKCYSSSEIYQDSPTIVLELQHIKFEIVPAIDFGNYLYHNYYIPAKQSSYNDWVHTEPNEFNDELVRQNIGNGFQIKPLIRLIKYWNVLNRPSFESFALEKDIISKRYLFCNNLKEYFYHYMDNFSTNYQYSNTLNNKITRMHQIINEMKILESNGCYQYAESKIRELLPY